MRLAVTGGRKVEPDDRITRAFVAYLTDQRVQLVITGGCPTGIDRWAQRVAQSIHVPVCVFVAPWGAMGDVAGPWRNSAMSRLALADVLMAFPGNRGTASCVREFLTRGIPVVYVPQWT